MLGLAKKTISDNREGARAVAADHANSASGGDSTGHSSLPLESHGVGALSWTFIIGPVEDVKWHEPAGRNATLTPLPAPEFAHP